MACVGGLAASAEMKTIRVHVGKSGTQSTIRGTKGSSELQLSVRHKREKVTRVQRIHFRMSANPQHANRRLPGLVYKLSLSFTIPMFCLKKRKKPKNSHQTKWTTLSPSSSQGWLQRYGYLPRTEPGMSVLRSARTMQSAIAAMQRVYGLNVTGTLDEKTKE